MSSLVAGALIANHYSKKRGDKKPRAMKFNGKTYRRHHGSYASTKAQAKRFARTIRYDGGHFDKKQKFNARVVKDRTGYSVYKRRK